MSTELFRNYIDIIKEAEQPRVQLDEGMIDSLKAAAQSAIKKIAPDMLEKIKNFVSRALGKPIDQITIADATLANAKKLIAANQQTNEGLGGAAVGGILGAIISLGAIPTNFTAGSTVLIGAAFMAILFAAFGAFATSGPAPVSPEQQVANDQAAEKERDRQQAEKFAKLPRLPGT